jgi:catechol 2,3-dioxygenase-like lactoylglutathione lyase family enzyme
MRLHGIHHVGLGVLAPQPMLSFLRQGLGLALLHEGPSPLSGSRIWLGAPGSGPLLAVDVESGGRTARLGRGGIHRCGWRVSGDLEAWERRLTPHALRIRRRPSTFSKPEGPATALGVTDPAGIEHELVPALPRGDRDGRPGVVEGIAGVRAYAGNRIASGDILAGRLAFEALGPDAYRVGATGRSALYLYDDAPPVHPVAGHGSITHVGWACDAAQLPAWRQRVVGLGCRAEPITDFGLYRGFRFREPSGATFEIATPAVIPATPPAPQRGRRRRRLASGPARRA